MGHVILDRRQEPRFELPGRFRCISPAGLNGRVIDLSLNETLSRTVMTVLATLIALFSLLFFGGPVVFGFALASILGILVGSYSSIWVASAIVLWLGVKRDWATRSDPAAAGRARRSGA